MSRGDPRVFKPLSQDEIPADQAQDSDDKYPVMVPYHSICHTGESKGTQENDEGGFLIPHNLCVYVRAHP